MKYNTYILVMAIMLLAVMQAGAQQHHKGDQYEMTAEWTLGGKLGVQAGGAIPIPLSALSGKESAVHVNLGVYPLLAVRAGYKLSPKWRLLGEVSYAATGFDADARVTNQRIKETDEAGDETVKYFTGVSHIRQSFAFFEVPLYAEFSISPRNKLLMGVYGAYQSSGAFQTTAVKGFVGVNPNSVEAPVTDPIESDFSNDLHHWDIGITAGYEFVLLPRFNAGVRFSFSPFDIFSAGKDYFDYTMHQLRGAVTLSYDFWQH